MMTEGLNARKSAGMAVGAEEGDVSSPIDDSPRLAARIQVRHLDTGVRSVSLLAVLELPVGSRPRPAGSHRAL